MPILPRHRDVFPGEFLVAPAMSRSACWIPAPDKRILVDDQSVIQPLVVAVRFLNHGASIEPARVDPGPL